MAKFETHITVDPCVSAHDIELFKWRASLYGFHVADLRKRNGEPSNEDEFCTAHDDTYKAAKLRCGRMVAHLQFAGINVRRFKIEHVLIDSRNGDRVDV